MTFIETVAAEEATGAAAELYATEEEVFGFLPNLVRAFSLRPEVYFAWKQLNGAVKGGMELRRYELATIAAARELRSSYCTLAHGSVLLKQGSDPRELEALVENHHTAGLDTVEIAVMDLADKVASDAGSVTQADIDGLRALGLTDGVTAEKFAGFIDKPVIACDGTSGLPPRVHVPLSSPGAQSPFTVWSYSEPALNVDVPTSASDGPVPSHQSSSPAGAVRQPRKQFCTGSAFVPLQ